MRRFELVGARNPTIYLYSDAHQMVPPLPIELKIDRAKIGALLRLAGAMADVADSRGRRFTAGADYDKARAAVESAARELIPDPIRCLSGPEGSLRLSRNGRDWVTLCVDDLLHLAEGLLLADEP